MKPFIKWAGGKARLAEQIISYFPEDMSARDYYEPFMGAAAVYLRLAEVNPPKRAFLSDVEDRLVGTFDGVRNTPRSTTKHFLGMADRFAKDPKATFDQIKSEFNRMEGRPPALLAAQFLFLNRACFNGLYRTNKKGELNTPIGDKTEVSLPVDLSDYETILYRVDISCGSFFDLSRPERGSVVYADPPYLPLSKTANFTGYAGGFGLREQSDLADRLREWDDAGVVVVASNSDTPETRELYGWAELVEVQAARAVGARYAGTSSKVTELIIRGKTRS